MLDLWIAKSTRSKRRGRLINLMRSRLASVLEMQPASSSALRMRLHLPHCPVQLEFPTMQPVLVRSARFRISKLHGRYRCLRCAVIRRIML